MRVQLRWAPVAFMVCVISMPLSAGVFEVSSTVNYRESTIDKQNYQKSTSVTGAISWYFGEMSAIELSYTDGYSEQSVKPVNDDRFVLKTTFQLIGLDLVFSFADRDAAFQPFIKMGAGYLKKEALLEPGDDPTAFDSTFVDTPEGIVPSGGIGFRMRMTKSFFFKAGLDAWTTPIRDQDDIVLDYAGRAGVSWLF